MICDKLYIIYLKTCFDIYREGIRTQKFIFTNSNQHRMEAPIEITDEQRFQILFRGKVTNYVGILKNYGCFTENWGDNIKHAIRFIVNDDCPGYANAMEQVAKTKKLNKDTLLLHSMILFVIPSNILQLAFVLKNLTLSDLYISELPYEVQSLSNLEIFRVVNCNIETLPPWIGELRKLTTLEISRCLLRSIPETLDRCDKLHSLNLSYNDITTIPSELFQMSSIERLILNCNPSLNINLSPTSFSGTIMLNISETSIRKVPAELVAHLIWLSWKSCELLSTPTTFGTTLQYLNLSNNLLKELPSDFTQLTNLNYLNIASNHFEIYPPVLPKMPWVKKLHIQNNPMSVVM